MKWTDSQKEVLTASDKLLFIEAGAGSGKTAVLTERIIQMINDGIDSSKILAITFTEKAADELYSRLKQFYSDVLINVEARTFHGFCVKILKEYGHWMHLNPDFQILEDGQSLYQKQLFLRKHFKFYLKENDSIKEFVSNFGAKATSSWILNYLNCPTKFITDNSSPMQLDQLRFNKWLKLMDEIKNDWKNFKIKKDILEYDDLLYFAFDLLDKKSDLKDIIINRYKYIFVDEFQDTDPLQGKILLSLIEHKNAPKMFIVGDWKQSIYGFRGADLYFVEEFKEKITRQGGRLLSLKDNFRSSERIINFLNDYFAYLFRDKYISQNSYYKREDDFPLEVFIQNESCESKHSKYSQMTALAKWMTKQNRLWSDFAFLIRVKKDSIDIVKVLEEFDIPYELSSGTGFFQSQEILDIINFLKLIIDPNDYLMLVGVLRSMLFGWTDEEILLLFLENDNKRDKSILKWDSSHSQINKKWQIIKNFLQKFIDESRWLGPSEIISRLLKETAFYESLYAFNNPTVRRANVEKLIYMADQNPNMCSVREFVDLVKFRIKQADDNELQMLDNMQNNTVKIMTIHKAKGLEFPIVLLPFLDKKTRSNQNPWVFNRSLGGVFKTSDYENNVEENRMSITQANNILELEEEMRLFYVACSRAREKVICTAHIGSKKGNPVFD